MTTPDVLAVQPTGDGDEFIGHSPDYDWGRIYGGLVIAQGLMAAGHTVPTDMHPHSLHAYFIRGGDPAQDIGYSVERVRDGRSFVTRAVHARQRSGVILMLMASFQLDEAGHSEHVATPPDLPPPDSIERAPWGNGMDCREFPTKGNGEFRLWARFDGHPISTRLEHAAALAYLSDAGPMDAIVDVHPTKPEPGEWDQTFVSASLDHAIWFHQSACADDWLLFDFTGSGLHANRGVAMGHAFSNGQLVASIAQEGLLRTRRSSQ